MPTFGSDDDDIQVAAAVEAPKAVTEEELKTSLGMAKAKIAEKTKQAIHSVKESIEQRKQESNSADTEEDFVTASIESQHNTEAMRRVVKTSALLEQRLEAARKREAAAPQAPVTTPVDEAAVEAAFMAADSAVADAVDAPASALTVQNEEPKQETTQEAKPEEKPAQKAISEDNESLYGFNPNPQFDPYTKDHKGISKKLVISGVVAVALIGGIAAFTMNHQSAPEKASNVEDLKAQLEAKKVHTPAAIVKPVTAKPAATVQPATPVKAAKPVTAVKPVEAPKPVETPKTVTPAVPAKTDAQSKQEIEKARAEAAQAKQTAAKAMQEAERARKEAEQAKKLSAAHKAAKKAKPKYNPETDRTMQDQEKQLDKLLQQ